MLDLSLELATYIDTAFNDAQKVNLYNGFSLLNSFDFPFYEDKYTDVLYSSPELDPSEYRDLIISYMHEDLSLIIDKHGITFHDYSLPTLSELNEIASCLLLIPNLEDKSVIRYRVNSDKDSKEIFSEILNYYTSISIIRSLEIIESVSRGLIDSMIELSEETEEHLESLDRNHLKYINYFIEFIGEASCIGRSYYEQGYLNKLTLEELLKFIPIDMEEYIKENLISKTAQVGLDILSIMIVTKGEFDLPVNKFSHNTELFTTDVSYVSKLTLVMNAIMNDFNTFLVAKRQEEAINNGGNN